MVLGAFTQSRHVTSSCVMEVCVGIGRRVWVVMVVKVVVVVVEEGTVVLISLC